MDYDQLLKIEQDRRYISGMRPVFNRKALFSDTTEDYVSPSEPNPYSKIVIRFRAAINNIDRVFMVNKGVRHLMTKKAMMTTLITLIAKQKWKMRTFVTILKYR